MPETLNFEITYLYEDSIEVLKYFGSRSNSMDAKSNSSHPYPSLKAVGEVFSAREDNRSERTTKGDPSTTHGLLIS